MTKIVLPQHQV